MTATVCFAGEPPDQASPSLFHKLCGWVWNAMSGGNGSAPQADEPPVRRNEGPVPPRPAFLRSSSYNFDEMQELQRSDKADGTTLELEAGIYWLTALRPGDNERGIHYLASFTEHAALVAANVLKRYNPSATAKDPAALKRFTKALAECALVDVIYQDPNSPGVIATLFESAGRLPEAQRPDPNELLQLALGQLRTAETLGNTAAPVKLSIWLLQSEYLARQARDYFVAIGDQARGARLAVIESRLRERMERLHVFDSPR